MKTISRHINMDTKLAGIQAKSAFTGHSGYTDRFDQAIERWKRRN